jgi:predicted transcriptional regulator YdeE
VADFRYITLPDFAYVVEDAKGHETDVARIKRHLMKSVHGIDVRIS